MSDVGRYRKLYPRIWSHPKYRRLKQQSRELAIYLLTGPQTNRIGLFRFSVATAAEDLGTTPETLRECIGDVCEAFAWHFDDDARVFFIPSWWKWNQPENVRVLKGNLKDLNEVPPSPLMKLFARNLSTIEDASERSGSGTVTLHETFAEGCRIRIPEHCPTQEHYQEHFRAGAGTAAKNFDVKNLDSSDFENQLLAIARQALTFIESTESIETLVDTFFQLQPPKCSRADAVKAINTAKSEVRPS